MPFVSMTNANPDFFRTGEADGTAPSGRRTVLYSTLSSLPVAQTIGSEEDAHQLPKGNNVTIHALDVELFGPIAIPGGDVRIFCKTLRVPPDFHDKEKDEELPGASLDVSSPRDPAFHTPFDLLGTTTPTKPPVRGADGDSIAANHKPYGTAGAAGGSISIVCDELQLDGRLLLTADGARGYPGCNGQHGSPASADSTLPAGAGGNAGKGGKGGPGGTIAIQYRTLAHPERLICRAAPGDAGEPGQPGHEGGLSRCRPGQPAQPTQPATPGKVSQLEIDHKTLGMQLDDVLLQRMVQHARQLYLFNQPSHYTGDETLFPKNWGEQGLFLDWLVAVLDLGGPGGTRKAELYQDVYTLQSRHNNKSTFDNLSADWVPSNPLKLMVANFKNSFAGRAAVETTYQKLARGYADAKDAALALDEARTNAATTTAVTLARYEAFLQQLTDSSAPIRLAVSECEQARVQLTNTLTTLKEAVKNHFDFSIGSVLKALEMVVFTLGGEPAQGLAMAGTEIATLVNEGMTKITNDEGEDVSKAKLLGGIKELGNAIKTANRDELFRYDEDGKPVIDPAHQAALEALQAFRDDITHYRGTLGPDVVDPATYGLDHYIWAISEKGKAIVVYHLLTTSMLKAYERYDQARTHEKELADRKEPLDPVSVGMVSRYAQLYQQQLEDAMADYARLQRKYAYVELAPIGNGLARAASATWTHGTPMSTETVKQINDDVTTLNTALAAWAGSQPGSSHKFPADDSMRSLLKVVIDEPAMLDELRRTGSLKFTTVRAGTPVAAGKPWHVPILNSDAFYDIRITHVRPRLIGARTDSNTLLVKAHMSTWSELYGSDGTRFHFTHHTARTADFEHLTSTTYDAKVIGDNKDIGMGGIGELTDTFLDAVGAFTAWKVWVPTTVGDKSVNANFNLSGVTALVVYFSGSVRSTSMNF